MRQSADLVLQQGLHVLTGHSAREILGRRNTKGLHSLDDTGQHEIDRLNGPVGLFGKNEGGVF